MPYRIVFDSIILNQLKKLGENESIRSILTKMMDKIEELGPRAGKLIDSHLFIYEMKTKNSPLRLYFKHAQNNDIYLFEYELKTSKKKQQKTIEQLRQRVRTIFRN